MSDRPHLDKSTDLARRLEADRRERRWARRPGKLAKKSGLEPLGPDTAKPDRRDEGTREV